MKTINILTFAAAAAVLASCSTQEFSSPGNGMDGMLMVRPTLSEMEIISKAGVGQAIYAYPQDEMLSGTINPISHTLSQGDIYYYKVPQECQNVMFSNINGSDAQSVMFSTREDGTLVLELKDQTWAGMSTDILFGTALGITAGNESAYDVPLDRLSSIITSKLIFTDFEGNQMTDDSVEAAEVSYGGFSTTLSFDPGSNSWTASGSASLFGGFSLIDNVLTTESFNIIPGTDVNTCTVTLHMADGSSTAYETTLDRVLDFNRSYTVTFRLKKANGTASFTLEEPYVYEQSFNASYTYQGGLFQVQDYWYTASAAGASVNIPVTMSIPYEWDFSIIKGGDWFSVSRTGNDLTVTALSDNESETRVGILRLTSANGDTHDICISQMNKSKQIISFIKDNTYSDTQIYVTGDNIEIDCGNGMEPYNAGTIELDYGISQGTTITIQGDAISEFGCQERMLSTLNFSNCVSLMSLDATTSDGILDVSALTALKSLTVRESNINSLQFAPGQDITDVSIFNCDLISSLLLDDIAGSLKELAVSDCDALATYSIYPSGYSGEKVLESVEFRNNTGLTGASFYQFGGLKDLYINNCYNITSLNLSECVSLEALRLNSESRLSFINLSNCYSLKDIRFEYCNSISTIMTDGADAIETVTFGYNVGIDGTLDLSGKTSLKQIILESGNVECKVLDLSGCTSLEKIVNSDDYYISTENCNITGCTLLDKLNISFSSTTSQDLSVENSGLASLTIHNLNFSFDFTSVPELQELKLQNTRASIDLDLTACSSLKTFEFGAYNSSSLKSLLLPYSLEQIYLSGSGAQNISGTLDFSMFQSLSILEINSFNSIEAVSAAGCPELTYLTVRNCNTALRSINATGCAKLESCNVYSNSTLETILLDNCTSLKTFNSENQSANLTSLKNVSLTGCSALTGFYARNSGLEAADFSQCTSISEIDIRNNMMTAEGLDSTFGLLPDRNSQTQAGNILIYGNPGANSCNTSIALNKYWQVSTN